jgi:hypothetical protein
MKQREFQRSGCALFLVARAHYLRHLRGTDWQTCHIPDSRQKHVLMRLPPVPDASSVRPRKIVTRFALFGFVVCIRSRLHSWRVAAGTPS